MGAETNELDTRAEDLHRNNKTLREWENEEEDITLASQEVDCLP
jgi:hypothetical protein